MTINTKRINEDEIDIKVIFIAIFRYKYMIIFFIIIFTLGSAYYAYFKPNIYRASTTVEVGLDNGGSGDILSKAFSPKSGNSATEIEIIKSRFLAGLAAKKVDVLHRYYTIQKFKEIELYKSSPFEVGMLRGYGISFDLYPIDEKSYRLVVEKQEDYNGDEKIYEIGYDKNLPYGKEINTFFFHLNVIQKSPFIKNKYRFIILNPKQKASIAQIGISVRQLRYSSILEISYEDNVALRAQEFADALADAYLEQNIAKRTKEASQKLKFIEYQLKSITQNLKISAVKIEKFKQHSRTFNLESKSSLLMKQMGEKESVLLEISLDNKILTKLYRSIKAGKDLETLSILDLSNSASSVAPMIKSLQEAILQKKLLREDYTELYPKVIKLTKTIIQLKKVIVFTLKSMQKNIKEKKILLEQTVANQKKLLNKLPVDERRFGQLQRKFSVNEKIYSYLLEKQSETAILKASTVSKNRILDRALYPTMAIKPKRKSIVISGLLFGLVFGVALAFLRGFLDNTIKTEEDISNMTIIPLLGIIPHIKMEEERDKFFSSSKSASAESFRHLRTNLQFMRKEKSTHIIAVTSTISAEGKTITAMNLAIIISIANKKTIILNMDMRKPTLHTRFNLKNTKGMSNLLSTHIDLIEVIQATEYENLDVITSGPVPPNPSELIQSELMEEVLKELSKIYDNIIMDTPPIGIVTDARILMHLSDTTIFIIRSEFSKKPFLKNIENLYTNENIKGLSLVLNDVSSSNNGYGYGYYEEDNK